MDINHILDNISSFIIDPNRNTRTSLEKGFAWATTIIVAVGTLGIAHCLSALWRQLRHIEKNDTQEQMSYLFHALFSQGKKAKDTDLQSMAEAIVAKSDDLWLAASLQFPFDKESAFINKIRQEFKSQGHSLAELNNHLDLAELFLQKDPLKKALIAYARVNNLKNILDKHLVLITTRIYEKRDEYSKEAGTSTSTPQDMIMYFIDLLRNEYKKEERSLSEVFGCKEAKTQFQASNRLALALSLYLKIIQEQYAPEEGPTEAPDIHKADVAAAIDLGKADALKEAGLVTRLGLQDKAGDPEKLKKGVMQFLRIHHPDKGGDEPGLAAEAGRLLNMLKEGVYTIYRKTLEEQRRKRG